LTPYSNSCVISKSPIEDSIVFCQQCGKPLDASAQFCGICGARTPVNKLPPSLSAASPEISDAVARQSLAGHVRVIGILWAIYSGFRILMAIWTVVFSRVFMPAFMDGITKAMAQQNNTDPDVAPIFESVMRMMSGFYILSAVISILAGALGLWAAWALMKRERSGRMLALVVACVSLISIPLGTALGVYTLVVFLPNKTERIYRELETTQA
jgi:zinc-ribbon domain